MRYGIDTLKAKKDPELLELLGLDQKLAVFKEALAEADTLKGEPRKKVEDRINSMLTPNIYPEDLRYAVRDAKRSGKEEMCNCCPTSVMD